MAGWILLICIILLILLSVVFFFVDDIRNYFEKRYTRRKVYNVLKYFADENDQLLLNNVLLYLPGDKDRPTSFDHLVFADKYVYVIHDYYAYGGLYGNVNDRTLFVRDYHDKVKKVENPVVVNESRVRRLEDLLNVPPESMMFVSVVVYNNSLIVPKGIAKKEQTSWFLPLKDLEKTLKKAELDDVEKIGHEKTESLAKTIRERSEQIKQEYARQMVRHSR